MKKLLVLLIPFLIGAMLFFGYQMLSNKKAATTALQVTATPQAEVFLDNTSIGKTPLYNDKLAVGEHTLKLVPQGSSQFVSFEEKVTLRPNVLTVVDRIFRQTEAESESSIITLEGLPQKNAVEIAIVSSPDSTDVKLDDQPQGVTPLLLKDAAVSDHQITISKDGYNSKTLSVRPNEGYRLTITAKLAIAKASESVPTTPTPSEERAETQVTILATPVGFLRVRKEPSTQSEEVTRVKPTETYPFLDEQEGWYKIKVSDEEEGWISSQYARKEE